MKLFPVVLRSVLFFLVLVAAASAREGFHPISELRRMPEYRDAYGARPNCGSVRIHDARPIFLTALHCLVKDLQPTRTVNLGNEMNSEGLLYFEDLAGRKLPGGGRVLAAGGCFTGFAIDVLNGEKPARVAEAIRCAARDWAIFEDARAVATECAAVAARPIAAGDALANLGSPDRAVRRKTGMTRLDGKVYSTGNAFALDDLLKNPRYAFGKEWTRLADVFARERGGDAILIADAEAIGGMSGGPILDGRFRIAGVSTLALVPNEIWRYEGRAYPLDDGYNFGILGGIRVESILSQLERAGNVRAEEFFRCPVPSAHPRTTRRPHR